ncbi:hypothetical protein GXM_00311 [Nostoc sphaeroides CCNUC1]|uniref:Uncharacterized protein n=1 Tax=Nostoc sphaeroides CCNUC1 TaxID=2653204 RepID=A0A5P8VQV8_9NOSO|nr:hypothetical protein GXM_00311 [Nostoc sphaeroides CCNUC1]
MTTRFSTRLCANARIQKSKVKSQKRDTAVLNLFMGFKIIE